MSNMFGANLKYFRISNGMTQNDLAKALGIKRSRVSMYELGEREPSFEMLEAIADVFNVNMSTLLGEEIENAHPQIENGLNNWFSDLVGDLTLDEQQKVAAYIQGLKANRKA